MTQSPQDIERDIEASRARLDGALDKLQGRMHPAGIVEDLLATARRNESGAGFYDGAIDAVRHHPLAVLMICGGAALFLRQLGRQKVPPQSVERKPVIVVRGRMRADRMKSDVA